MPALYHDCDWRQHDCIVTITNVKTVAERLRSARLEKGWTQSQLAVAAGLSQGTIANIESGARQAKGSLPQIADALGVPHSWLARGEPREHILAFESIAVYETSDPDYPPIRRVELKLQAGVSGFEVNEEPEDEAPIVFRRSWFQRNAYRPEKLIAVRVRGASMEPGLFEGDTVVINTAQTQPIDGFVFAVNYEGEAVIKRLVRDGGQWWLSSDNPDQARYPRKIVNGHVIIIGQIVHKQSERI